MSSSAEVYDTFVESLLESEEARKTSLEQRGTSVLTTSSALATLLFGLVGVITSAKTFTLPDSARPYLFAAVTLFTAAVACGLLVNVPFLYRQATPTAETLADIWTDSETDARLFVVATNLKVLTGVRRSNAVKSLLLLLAGVVQLAALSALVLGVLAILGAGASR